MENARKARRQDQAEEMHELCMAGLRHLGPVPRNFPYAIDGRDWLETAQPSLFRPCEMPPFQPRT
jgi:hypothetical protein